MLTIREAKVIAGKILVEKYGIDFVRNNIDKRLFTGSMDQGESYRIDFELFKENIDKVQVIRDGRLINEESSSPEIILAVEVNKQDGKTTIVS